MPAGLHVAQLKEGSKPVLPCSVVSAHHASMSGWPQDES